MAKLKFYLQYIASELEGLEDIHDKGYVLELSADDMGECPELDFIVVNEDATHVHFSIGGFEDITMLMKYCKTVLKLYGKHDKHGV